MCIICIVVLTCGCYYESTQRTTIVKDNGGAPSNSSYVPNRLTVSLIDEFNISAENLHRLKYYLENGLTLRRAYTQSGSAVTSQNALDLSRHTTSHDVVFEHQASGKALRIWKEFQLSHFGNVYKIQVGFYDRNGQRWALTFSPNLHGEYVVDKSLWFNTVEYNGVCFEVLNPQIENYLSVDAQLHDRQTPSQKVIPAKRRLYGY